MMGSDGKTVTKEGRYPFWGRRRFIAGVLLAPVAWAGPSGFLSGQAAAAADFSPVPLNDGLGIGAAGAVGMDTDALWGALRGVRDGGVNIHSVLVMRHGALVAELYRAGSDRSLYSLWSWTKLFQPTDLHDMRSVSKSVTSLLYGILLARGEVPDLDASVPALYPDYAELNDPSRQAIRVRHLLTMTAGLDWTEPSPVRRASSTDESGLVFHQCAFHYVFKRDVVAIPGTQFLYSGGLTAVLAEIMERSTKRSFRDLARDELFAPLGIDNWDWVENLHGTPMAAAGLRLEPRGLMKIGAMMLAGGEWQGRRIVPASWIAEATTPHMDTPPVGGYGYYWWSTAAQWNGAPLAVTAAWGNGGQRLFLVPDLDLAMVITAGDYGDPTINAPLAALLDEIVGSVVTA